MTGFPFHSNSLCFLSLLGDMLNTLWELLGSIASNKGFARVVNLSLGLVFCFPLLMKSRLPDNGSEWLHLSGMLPGCQCSVILTILTFKRKIHFI